MAYRLGDEETAAQAVRRSAEEQLDRAIAELTERIERDPVEAIHAARKALKMERSLLRLARGGIKPAVRRRENEAFRDVGRRLSKTRDADVMAHALDDLANRYAGQLPQKAFASIREYFEERGRGARDSLIASGVLADVTDELRAARLRVQSWRLRGKGWNVIGEGLTSTYRRGRRAFKDAKADPTVERLHEWRKRAKDHWYHLRLLQPLAPGTMCGQAEDAHRLADLLGDDHDLAVLREELHKAEPGFAVDVHSVIALLDHRRAQLQAEAVILAERLYAEKPKAFTRRIHAYWKAWREETRTGRAQHPAQLADLTRQPAAA